jgi:nucleoside-diphosphate-sugar epimerase
MNFVTGSTGLVGAYLILDLLRRGEKVRALRRSTSSVAVIKRVFSLYEPERWNDLYNKIEWIEGDLLDFYVLQDAMEGVKDVYHSAGFVSYQPEDYNSLYEINQKGTENMVNAALAQNIRKFCYVSSISTLGAPDPGRKEHTEEDFLQKGTANTHYGFSKYYGEQEVWRGAEEGLNMVIVNPSIILGFGDYSKGSTQLFTKIYDGLKFYTPGTTGFVDVRDVVKIMVVLTKSDISLQRFIINAVNLPFREMFALVAKAFNKRPPHIQASYWMGEVYWRLEAIKSALTGQKALVTKETARAGQRQNYYSSARVKEVLDYEFIPIEETVEHIAGVLRKELSYNSSNSK